MAGSEVMDEEWIRDHLLSLREGDEIIVNDRERTWTLVERYWDDHESGYWRYRFSGYGTHYEGIVPPDGSPGRFTSEGGKHILVTSIRTPKGEKPAIISDTSVEAFIGDAGNDLKHRSEFL